MNALALLQSNFQKYLLHESLDIQNAIVSTQHVTASTRLGIYRDSYQARLVEALGVNYPCLYAWLGDDMFRELALDYMAQYPSHYRSIRWFGDSLPVFLKDYFEKEYVWLSDLAAFEWLMTLVFDAKDAPLFSVEDMSRIPPDAWDVMRVIFHPAMMRIGLTWDIIPMWEALTHDLELPEHVEPYDVPVSWVLWRADGMIHFNALSSEETACLDALQQGCSFGEMCEILCQWYSEEEVGIRAAQYLRGWLEAGWVMACREQADVQSGKND